MKIFDVIIHDVSSTDLNSTSSNMTLKHHFYNSYWRFLKLFLGEATEEDIKKASQLQGSVLPIKPVVKRQRAMELTDDLKKFKAFNSIRQARAVARLWGIRAKKAKEAEADDLSKPAKK